MYSNELYHHGIKGMKWGVRRYQNYNGEYTQEGLRRYKAVNKQYQDSKNAYNSLKKNGGSKDAIREAREHTKYYKRESNLAYKSLKRDNKADKGRKLYESGKKGIIARGIAKTVGTLGASGGAYALAKYGLKQLNLNKRMASKFGKGAVYNSGLVSRTLSNPKVIKNMATGATVLAGLGLGMATETAVRNSRIRAYKNHRYYNRELQDWEKKKK